MRDLGAALGRLDPESRALLDLSMRRGMTDEEIAAVLRVEPGEVHRRRDELLERLAEELAAAAESDVT
jgi:DNA-directed RNA polymerase specialized sigma24 family protein